MDTIMANKKIRILVDQQIDGIPYRCNDVVDLPAELAKPLLEQGAIDDNKAAVAYCLNDLGATVIAHRCPRKPGRVSISSSPSDSAFCVARCRSASIVV